VRLGLLVKYSTYTIAGYWDRIAIHMSGAMQYLASLEEMTGTSQPELRARMWAVQQEVTLHRAQEQAKTAVKGHG
jgi:hypothetical protein